ncbi:hypothetical protein GCM10027184_76810 [Saccharothrix stipae]
MSWRVGFVDAAGCSAIASCVEVLTDELWAWLEPLIPLRPRRFRHPGRRRADDRAALEGILYVVRTGIGWNRLPPCSARRARRVGAG